jgi:ribosomal-protein-alanine N-acetyltransferase
MIIRTIKQEDIKQIVDLELKFLGETIGEELLSDSIKTPHLYFYVVEDINVIGYIGAYILAGQTEILNFVIDEKYQRQGLGQKLFDKILEDSKNNKSESVVLEVKVNNQKGIGFYEKNGFKNVNVRKNYYADGTDAYLMLKEL